MLQHVLMSYTFRFLARIFKEYEASGQTPIVIMTTLHCVPLKRTRAWFIFRVALLTVHTLHTPYNCRSLHFLQTSRKAYDRPLGLKSDRILDFLMS